MILYHYTTKEAHEEIMRTNELKSSTPWTTMDAAYGTGWYFTDLGPDTESITIAFYCWSDSSLTNRAEYYLKFNIDKSICKYTREHVYMVESWNENLIKYLGGSKK